MNSPVVSLPRDFDGQAMAIVVKDLINETGNKLPKEITFNFQSLGFIRPAGVAFLNNLVRWLQEKGAKVFFSGLDLHHASIQYLDDSLFFEHHMGQKLRPLARLRSTTLPLREVKHAESHMWLRMSFVPWLAERLGIPAQSLGEIQTCVSELFNNIKDHTRYDIGCIFVQHFPKEDRVIIAVSDFGSGIPSSVRKVAPDLDDVQAIKKAVEEGFSSKSIPTNRGAGLDYLMRVVALTNRGKVTIYSRSGIVTFGELGGAIMPLASSLGGFSPGTLIEIELRTDMISAVEDDSEEFKW